MKIVVIIVFISSLLSIYRNGMSHVNICFAHSRTILILALGIVGIVSMSCYTGLVIYAAFHDCDPISKHVREINGSTVTFADI